MKHIQSMIEQRGGFQAVRDHYIRLENPPLLRLVIEVSAGPHENGAHQLSVAHYCEQNGDAMRDPEITFLVTPVDRGLTWTPLTYANRYLGCYQVAAEVTQDGRLAVRDQCLLRDLRDFANQWDRNIRAQGFMEVFKRQRTNPQPEIPNPQSK